MAGIYLFHAPGVGFDFVFAPVRVIYHRGHFPERCKSSFLYSDEPVKVPRNGLGDEFHPVDLA